MNVGGFDHSSAISSAVVSDGINGFQKMMVRQLSTVDLVRSSGWKQRLTKPSFIFY